MSSGGYSIYRKHNKGGSGSGSIYRKQKEPAGNGIIKVSPLCVKDIYNIHSQTNPELLDTRVPFTNTLYVENKFTKPDNTFNTRFFDNSKKFPTYHEMFHTSK